MNHKCSITIQCDCFVADDVLLGGNELIQLLLEFRVRFGRILLLVLLHLLLVLLHLPAVLVLLRDDVRQDRFLVEQIAIFTTKQRNYYREENDFHHF